MLRVAVAGASGYIGGELLRLLLGHPEVTVAAATSRRYAGRPVGVAHPNLRSVSDLRFIDPGDLDRYDVLFLATPHRETMARMDEYLAMAPQVIDLTGDFRLRDPAAYAAYYGGEHTAPGLLDTFVTGMPELYRKELREADRISVPGCMATAAILAVHPLTDAGLVTGAIAVDARTGSSGSGVSAGSANLHAERSGAMRVFAPLRHRHEAEIAQATGFPTRMNATGVEAVRGVQILARVRLREGTDEKTVRAVYRERYADEPFVRVVAQKRGQYRLPEPKILSGSNFCDVGFAVAEDGEEALLVGALDNLVKGGAGNAVQSMNVRQGWSERLGLEFPGLHP
ncbi:N-acetyl-gamma-glutamyl-phosphate reductase [Streptomyces sp. NPDC014894]|uniref:N-acetyl-gamma-glutamyl-phosphate reductase n=1 Tax=unclassified Streptomyces TaxID=2593676 RepID=UPI0036FA8679